MDYPNMFDLSGKVAVVTGAASGLGVVFAEAMAEAGADVVCADINVQGLRATEDRVKAIGRRALSVVCDVSREEDVKAMIDKTVETFGRLDIIFNNAGIAESAPTMAHEFSTDEWNRVLAVDLHGVPARKETCLPYFISEVMTQDSVPR